MFFSEDLNLHTAMFPDLAVADACVTCHNQHPQSPKNDWQRGELMGATTWSYPHKWVSIDQLLTVLTALRGSIRDAYAGYLQKTTRFTHPPEIGDAWPRDGYYLPTTTHFMAEMERRASPKTLALLLDLTQQDQRKDTPVDDLAKK